jgi:hypothetical protein
MGSNIKIGLKDLVWVCVCVDWIHLAEGGYWRRGWRVVNKVNLRRSHWKIIFIWLWIGTSAVARFRQFP